MRTDISRFPVGLSDGWPRRGGAEVRAGFRHVDSRGGGGAAARRRAHREAALGRQHGHRSHGRSVHTAGDTGIEAELILAMSANSPFYDG